MKRLEDIQIEIGNSRESTLQIKETRDMEAAQFEKIDRANEATRAQQEKEIRDLKEKNKML